MVVHNAILTQDVKDGPNAGKAVQVIVPINLGNDGWNKLPDTDQAGQGRDGPGRRRREGLCHRPDG